MLPRELLLLITDCLDLKSHSTLSRTCWYLTVHLQCHLFTRDNKINQYPAMFHGCSRELPLGHDVLYALEALSGNSDKHWPVNRTHCVTTIQTLLEAGADPTCQLPRILTKSGHAAALTVVLDTCDLQCPNRRLKRTDAVRLVRELVLNGAKTDARGREGFSPLRYAVIANMRSLVAFLLNHGADPNYGLNAGIKRTALGTAIEMDDVARINFLISKGANVNPDPSTGPPMSPIFHAVLSRADNDTVLALLDAGQARTWFRLGPGALR
jgi:ankyrin repeat protein